MTTTANNHPLHGLFEPQTVAILGASSDPNKLGGRPIRFLRDGGFQGKVYPVNSRNAEIQGYPAFASIKDIPGPVDQAIIILPATACQAALEECGEKGVKVVHRRADVKYLVFSYDHFFGSLGFDSFLIRQHF